MINAQQSDSNSFDRVLPDQNTPLGLSYNHCESLYSNRDYFEDSVAWQEKKPIMLLSQPGSGNTWTRLLIEYSTGANNDFKIYLQFYF